ncbi:MAG: NAD(P)H-binding protein [Corynebacterium sp.]|nr:NAD(P)H-binding protein [Corynebacterium sp.]
MKITIIGPGMVGQPIITEAAHRGHTVIAGSRSGRAVPDAAEALALELADTAALQKVIAHSDVTIIAASPDPVEPVIKAHENLVKAGFEGRLIVVGGAGSLVADGVELVDLPDFPEEYKAEARAFSAVLKAYRTSTDNWTMVCPSPEIAPAPATGEFMLGGDSPAGNYVSTGDFAIAIVNEAEKPRHNNQRFTVATKQI